MAIAKRLRCGLPALACWTVVGVAQAQEIVVTGTRHDSAVSKAPLAISAVPPARLANTGTENVSQLGALVPGLTPVNAGPGSLRLVMRGIYAVGEPTVGLYYDETPVTGSVGASNDAAGSAPQLKLFDVERVEVLRGPQGTLFGASAMTGAIRVLYRKPTFDYEGLASATGTLTPRGQPGFLVQGVANAPLVKDVLAARFVLYSARQGGYVDNAFLDRADVDRERTRGGRLLLRATPTRHFTVDGSAHLQWTDGQSHTWGRELGAYRSSAQSELPNHERFHLVSVVPRYDFGAVEAVASVSHQRRELGTTTGDASAYFATQLNNPMACARTQGGATCTEEQLAAFNEHVESVIPGISFWGQKTNTTTAEARVSSKSEGWLQWTGGAFFSRRDATADIQQLPADPASGQLLEPQRPQFLRVVDDVLSQWALYADVSAHLTRQLALTAGARGFVYRREVGGRVAVPLDLLGAAEGAYSSSSQSERGAVPKLGASYELTADHLVYAQVAEGFRPGGVNQVNGLPAALAPYQSDRVWSYELGAKTFWLGRRLGVSWSGYLMDWRNIQVTGSRPDGLFRFLSNAGAARVLGAEVELSVRPLPSLLVESHATLTDARLTEDQSNTTVVAPGRDGDRLPYVPRVAGAFAVQYTPTLSEDLRGFARVDSTFTGTSYSELRRDNPFRRKIEAYGVLNVRIGLQSPTTSWSGFLFVNNATGGAAVHYATANVVSLGQTWVNSAQPRTFGMTLRKSF